MENLDLPRLQFLKEHWADNLPVHIALSRFIGVEPKRRKAREMKPEDVAELMAIMPRAG